jgi:fructoselysine-6-P-deglycase FrlB-like protein
MSKSIIPSKTNGRISGAVPTEKSIMAEVHAQGPVFSVVKQPPADLIADADEMLAFRGDAKDMAARGYWVTDGMFTRMQLLADLLTRYATGQDESALETKAKVEEAERARVRLLEIRESLARIGVAAGLQPSQFSLRLDATKRLSFVLLNMKKVLLVVKKYRTKLPDRALVDAMVAEATQLISANATLRAKASSDRGARSMDGQVGQQLARMLFEVLQHLSHQGLAAYQKDLSRRAAYRLDHVYARRGARSTPDAPTTPVTPEG